MDSFGSSVLVLDIGYLSSPCSKYHFQFAECVFTAKIRNMIVACIFVTFLCGAFSLPASQSTISDDSEFKLISKRNVRLEQENTFDFHQPSAYSDESALDEQLDRGRPRKKMETNRWQEIFGPQRIWSPREHYSDPSVEDNNDAVRSNEDILLHLSADNDLIKFLQWTTSHLSSLNSYNASGNYNPGLNMWTKLNLSGRRELPLYVEEPQYIVIRRDPDNLNPHLNSNAEIPFIPPRGRKYMPNLENLISRYEFFVPNRGKKDKIKDIFKYDDLFFPNRGKKYINRSTSEGRRSGTLSRYYYQLRENDRTKKLLHLPPPPPPLMLLPGDCFTLCDDDITAAPPPPPVVTDQVGNINGLVSASTLHRLPEVSSSALDADAHGHQDDVRCGAGAGAGAGAVAECQKENDVKINGFDQSVKAQIHQRQHHPKGVASTDDSTRLSSSSASAAASLEASASSFLPLIRPDQVRRLQQPYPIRNKQWRGYYF